MTSNSPRPDVETDGDELLALTMELLILVHETELFHVDRKVKDAFLDAKKSVNTIRRKIERHRRRYVVAVIGLSNVGKSTLLNSLLGAELAPRRNRPCTSVPIEFCYDPNMRVTVFFEDKLDRPQWNLSQPEDIRRCLEGLTERAGHGSRGAMRRIEVSLPHPLLADGLVISDTPGFGAGQVADLVGTHDAALRAYLNRDVTQVFWVVLADIGIGKREVEFHDQFFSEVCDDLVVTGCEDWDPREQARF